MFISIFLSEASSPVLKCQLSTADLCGFSSARRRGKQTEQICCCSAAGGRSVRAENKTDRHTDRERERQTDRRTHTVPHAASRQGDSELAQVYVTGQDCFGTSPTLNSLSAHKIPLFFSLQAPALPRVFLSLWCCRKWEFMRGNQCVMHTKYEKKNIYRNWTETH